MFVISNVSVTCGSTWYIPKIDGSIHNMTYFVGPLVH